MRLDLCVAAKRFPPQYSGAGTRFQRYAPGFRTRGIDMRVFTTTSEYWSPPEVIDEISVYREYFSPVTSQKIFRAYSRGLSNYVADYRPDVLHMLNLPCLSTLLKIRRLGIPTVLSITMAPYTHKNTIKNTLFIFRGYLSKLWLVDRVIVSSDAVLKLFQKVGVPTSRFEIIPNGVDLDRFKPGDGLSHYNALSEALRIPIGAKVVLFVGALNPRKGLDLLAEAWLLLAKNLPDAILVIIGPDPMRTKGLIREIRDDRQAFFKKIQEVLSPVAERVRFVDVVENIEDYYRIGDLFVFPSRHEGMGNVVLEAFASRLPVLMTPFVGLPDAFGQPGIHYALAKPTAEDLAQKMADLLDSKSQRQMLADNGYGLVRQTMGLQDVLDKHAKLYYTLCRR